MIKSQLLAASVRCVFIVFASLLLAGAAAADDAGDSAPMSVPEAAPAAPDPVEPAGTGTAQRTFDDKVGDALDSFDRARGKVTAAAVDILILRTMGVGATCIGFGFFVAASPLTLPSLAYREAWGTFVGAPAEYTFERPLGQF